MASFGGSHYGRTQANLHIFCQDSQALTRFSRKYLRKVCSRFNFPNLLKLTMVFLSSNDKLTSNSQRVGDSNRNDLPDFFGPLNSWWPPVSEANPVRIVPDLYQEPLGADFRRFIEQPKSKKALISQGLEFLW